MKILVAPLEVLTDSRLTDPERRVLLALFSFRGKDTNTVFPGLEALAERSLVHDKTRVSKLTKSLSEKGWLTKKKRGFTGGNQYTLCVPSNLDSGANLEDEPKLLTGINSNLDSETNSNLDSDAKCKEQTIEQTIEQGGENSPQPNPVTDKSKTPPCPYQPLVDLYHEILPELPEVRVMNEVRKQQLRTLWKQKPNLDWWVGYFNHVKSSDFLCGRVDPQPGRSRFVADIEWITKQSNLPKIIEGARYHHRGRS